MDGVAATRADMVEFSGVFDSWSAWLSTQLHSHASQHANFVSESTEEVTSLRTKQQSLAQLHTTNNKGTALTHDKASTDRHGRLTTGDCTALTVALLACMCCAVLQSATSISELQRG